METNVINTKHLNVILVINATKKFHVLNIIYREIFNLATSGSNHQRANTNMGAFSIKNLIYSLSFIK